MTFQLFDNWATICIIGRGWNYTAIVAKYLLGIERFFPNIDTAFPGKGVLKKYIIYIMEIPVATRWYLILTQKPNLIQIIELGFSSVIDPPFLIRKK